MEFAPGVTIMINRINEELAKEGSIVPVPLIRLAVAIAFPAVVLGCVVERTIRWIFKGDEKR